MPVSFETFGVCRRSQSAGGVKMTEKDILAISIATLVIVLASLFLRYRQLQMLHKERLAALEKGIAGAIGQTLAPRSPRVYLLRGLMWSFAGTSLMILLLGIAISSRWPEPTELIMVRAKSLEQRTHISSEEARQIAEKDRRQFGYPLSAALIGLIPVGVGVAYLVFYYIDTRRGDNNPTQNSLRRVQQQ
jgi:hypothetical protein